MLGILVLVDKKKNTKTRNCYINKNWSIKIATLKWHRDPIYALDKGIIEELIFSGSGDKVIAQWNLKTFKFEKFASFPNVIYSICHISEKQLLLVGISEGNVHVLN